MDILKGYIPSATIIANKILLKTIKISIGDYLVYIPEVIRLFLESYRQFEHSLRWNGL